MAKRSVASEHPKQQGRSDWPMLTVLVALLAVSLPALATSGGPQPAQESCPGDATSFWYQGRQLALRACGGLLVVTNSEPLEAAPLTYIVLIKNLSNQIFEIDPRAIALNDSKPLDPEKIGKRLRSRATWASFLAGFGAAMSRTNSTSTVYGPGGTSTMETQQAPSQSEINAAGARAAEPLRTQANAISAVALRRNTLVPGVVVGGMVYFKENKKIREGTLRIPVGGGPVFTFRVRAKLGR